MKSMGSERNIVLDRTFSVGSPGDVQWIAIALIGAGVGYPRRPLRQGRIGHRHPAARRDRRSPARSPSPRRCPPPSRARSSPTTGIAGSASRTAESSAGASPSASRRRSSARISPAGSTATSSSRSPTSSSPLIGLEGAAVAGRRRGRPRRRAAARALRLALVAVAVGFLAGLLANAGGFLLVPLYLAALKLPIKTALSCSLAVAAVLAIPGTLVHAALGPHRLDGDARLRARVGAALEPRRQDRAAHAGRRCSSGSTAAVCSLLGATLLRHLTYAPAWPQRVSSQPWTKGKKTSGSSSHGMWPLCSNTMRSAVRIRSAIRSA